MTQKIKLFLAIISILFLSNCASILQMKPKNFSSLKDGERIVAFKLKFTYSNEIKNNNPLADHGSFCRLYFSKDGEFFSKFYPYKSYLDYIFVTTNNEELYLTGAECMEYRVFYNKARFRKIGDKIFTSSDKSDKISYGGDIEIDWIPEIFQITDLLNLGHLGNPDNGSFSMRIAEDYPNYVDFMKSNYGFDKDKLVNSFDEDISREISKMNSLKLTAEPKIGELK